MDNFNGQQNNGVSLEKQTQEIAVRAQNSPEIQSLCNKVDLSNAESVLSFGQDTAQEISQFADRILNSMETTKVEDSGTLLVQLDKIMNKFDVKDFDEKKPNMLQRMFNKTKNSVDALFSKYHTMGGEVDKVYVQLKQYENEIKQTNGVLDEMFQKNLQYFEDLEKYIVAGNTIINDFKTNTLPQLEQKAMSSVDQMDQVRFNNANQALEMMEQRVYDLELAKSVALQTMPQIKLIQKGNYNLVRKINSAFIITIPIFKQCLTQAITLKRQAVQAKAMAALDQKTNELLLRNAQNTALQSKLTATLAGGSSISLETLEKSWETIMTGIQETKDIQQQLKQERIDGTKKLNAIQTDYQKSIKG